MPPKSVTSRMVEREDTMAAGDVDDAIGNGRCLRQRTEVRRCECPTAGPRELIEGDGIAAIGYVNGVVGDGRSGSDGPGFVVAPDAAACARVISSQVAAAMTYR